jgi:hypothetical protein
MAHYGLLHQDRLNPLQWGRQNPNMPGAMSGDPSWGGALLGSGHQDPRAADPLLWSAGMRGGAGLVSQIPRAVEFAGRGAQEIWDSPIGGLVRSGDWRAPAEALLLDRFKKKAEQEFDPMRRKILQGIAGSVVDNPLIPLAGELLPKAIEAVPEVTSAGSLEVFANHADNILRNYLEGMEYVSEEFGMPDDGVYEPSDAMQAHWEADRIKQTYNYRLYPIRRVLERIRLGSVMAEGSASREIRDRSMPTDMFGSIQGVDEELGIFHWMRDYEPDKYNQLLKRAVDQAGKELDSLQKQMEHTERAVDRDMDIMDRLTLDEYNKLKRQRSLVEEDLSWLNALLNDDPASFPPIAADISDPNPDTLFAQEFDQWPVGRAFPREIPHRDHATLEDDSGVYSYINEVTRGAPNFAEDSERELTRQRRNLKDD